MLPASLANAAICRKTAPHPAYRTGSRQRSANAHLSATFRRNFGKIS
jgi:hypothetical protein